MNKIFSLLAVFITFLGTAQIVEPVKWSTSVVKVSDTELDLIITANIEDNWHLYSQFTPEGGPLPLVLTFKNQKGNYQLVGKAKEGKYKKVFNDIFEIDEYYFVGIAKFTQRVKVLNPKLKSIDVFADGQACIDGKCTQTEANLKFKLPELKIVETAVVASTDTVSKPIDSVATTKTDTAKQAITPINNSNIEKPQNKEGKSLWTIFFLAFLGGFAALLMPCIFPMIPMTVSFFTKQSKTKAEGIRNAVVYGLSIIVIYVLLGSLITGIFGPKVLNELSTSVTFNLIFFVLLVVFALSFLGAFEIMLPNSWANKVDKQADRGGIIGILFMALALAIVSFSCTGPIVGTLLFEAASKGGIGPIIGMLGFSLALALPFMLFAMFPGWLNSLPKSGGWLNTVKVFLGFLELALAFKFLSNADLVLQLHLLEREVFLAIWIAIFGTLALYLLGKITMPHDSPLPFISVGRLFTGLLVLSFTVYLIPGLWGAPLKLINAFPPPMEYSESPFGVGNSGSNTTENASAVILPNGAKSGPHGIIVFDDYFKGLAYAKTVHKPILLDFTGFACVNCRKMENNVWSDKRVLSILKNEVVLISLYVDDKREMPKREQYYSKSTNSQIETIGDKWTDFMLTKYKTNTQPLYVLTDLEGNNLNTTTPTTSYNPDVIVYESWLKAGIANFK